MNRAFLELYNRELQILYERSKQFAEEFPGVTYDEVSLALKKGDVFVFCTDGIFEALNEEGVEFGATRLTDVVSREREGSARAIVDAIFETVTEFRGTRPQGDDMTAVAVKITA